MGYISTEMGDCFSALLVSLMALWLALVDRNLFRPCFLNGHSFLQVEGTDHQEAYVFDGEHKQPFSTKSITERASAISRSVNQICSS